MSAEMKISIPVGKTTHNQPLRLDFELLEGKLVFSLHKDPIAQRDDACSVINISEAAMANIVEVAQRARRFVDN